MKVLLSPAMNMGDRLNKAFELSKPIFEDKASEIVKHLKLYDPFDLEINLDVAPKLAEKAFGYYLNFEEGNSNNEGGQALLVFEGLAYKNINVEDFTKEDFTFANETLRILSAMYGVLKPADIIQQYRLDFMCSFAKRGFANKNLYKYWGNKVYDELFKDNETVVCICSKEYEKLVRPFLKPNDKYINCEFLINKNGKCKAYATASKMARGQMARYIVKNRIQDVEQLKGFEYDGFKFSEYISSESKFYFVR